MLSKNSESERRLADGLVFVTGTNTEVGKTWLGARLTELLRARSVEVAARKPVMSFDASDSTTDAAVLAAATGEPEGTVCPEHRRYEVPMAPPMAAEILGRASFSINDLLGEISIPDRGLVFVEGVGGPRSPLASDGDSVALIDKLEPDEVILVGDSKLGAINDVLTSCDALGRRPLVYLNHFDPSDDLHVRNREWLEARCGLLVFVAPPALAEHLVRNSPTTLDARSQPMEVK